MRLLLPRRRSPRGVANRDFDWRAESRAGAAPAQRTRTAIRSRMGRVGRATRPHARGAAEHSDAARAAQEIAAPIRELGPKAALRRAESTKVLEVGSTSFSLWVLLPGQIKTHSLKPVLPKANWHLVLLRDAPGVTIEMAGKVYLVGAGPGDPEVLTRKAWRVLQSAAVALHDDLVSQEILRILPPTSQLVNVGKRCGAKSISQGEINALMVQLAREGKTVARLKSGDPLLVGRAGEEIGALRRAGIEFEVIP